jgi:hypothetical protein
MMTGMKHFATAALAACLPLLANAQPAPSAAPPPATEDIGSWSLACTVDRMTDRSSCVLRLKAWANPPGEHSPGLALEIQDRGGRLVPVVTARELTLEGAARGLLALSGTAQLRFPPNAFYEMPCGLEGRTLTCAPRRADAERAEREIAGAATALVRMTGMGSGGGSAEPVELRLTGTAQAMARYRQFTPPSPAQDDAPGISGREAMDRLRQLFGR